MKLSLKVEYSCRVLAQLARFYGTGKLAHIEDLARLEEVPANYLVQILNEMRNAGLIVSRRGKQGGYALAKAPEEVSLSEVLQAMEGNLLETNLQTKGESGPLVARIWTDISELLNEKIATITLRDFMPGESREMYYI
ncbi:MAG: Rrf2 family transcriptional regulator [Verrucomicrobiae bacterium]|nr:Rrf2 family transcriptional regulator [Verrucomicrobiae bacterium]